MSLEIFGDGTVKKNGNTALSINNTPQVSFENSVSQPGGFSLRNKIINGDMRIDQRNAGAIVNVSTATNTFGPDRWYGTVNGGNFSIEQTSTVPNNNFKNSIKITTTTASTPSPTSEFGALHQAIEGFNISDLGWGTLDAKPVTLSFWARSSLTGKFNIALVNHNGSRCNPAEFIVSSANTWVQYNITFAGDIGGSWQTNNQVGLIVRISIGDSDGYNGTVNTWNNSSNGYIGIATSGSVKLKATSGADLYFTAMQLEVGSVATPFEQRPYGLELSLCQRYYWKWIGGQFIRVAFGYSDSTTNTVVMYQLPCPMRATPSISMTNMTVNGTSITSSTVAAMNNNIVHSNATASGRTVNVMYQIYASVNNGSVELSAEL